MNILIDYANSHFTTTPEPLNPIVVILLVLMSSIVYGFYRTRQRKDIRVLYTVTSTTALFVGVITCFNFNKMASFQFLVSAKSLRTIAGEPLVLGADGLSMLFLLLTLFVFPICFVSA